MFSPSFCQSVVAKVKDELMERVWLDLSHLLFLLLHDFHGGFLQESDAATVSSAQISSGCYTPVSGHSFFYLRAFTRTLATNMERVTVVTSD